MTRRRIILNGLVLGSSVMMVFGDPASPGEQEMAEEPFTVTEKEIKLAGVTVNRETLEVRIEATVCLDSGILEYVVCRPNTFEHEAIFTTDAKPELVHAALLLGGLKPTPLVRGLTDLWWEKALKRENSRVKIEVEWKEEGKMKRMNLSSMLRTREMGEEDTDSNKGEKVVPDAWVFSGSFMHQNPVSGERFYAGNMSGILVGIWPDPSTVIQYGIASGNPYGEKHEGLEIDEASVPKLGTKVNLVLSRYFAPPK